MTRNLTNPKNVLVAVAWPYVNGDIHIGHLAGYLLPADVCARFHRMIGNKVLMVSGSDCFGTPITVEADKRKISPAELVEQYHPKAVELMRSLNLSYDLYTCTTTENHKKTTQQIFLSMMRKGFIFRDKSRQYYSAEEDRFLPDRYVEGTCPKCGKEGARSDQCDSCSSPLQEGDLINPLSKASGAKVELRETEHYFIDWPKLQTYLEDYFKKQAHLWRPWIRSETEKWLKEGLKPRAITRDLDWGVELPVAEIPEKDLIEGVERKRLYVWFDAVIGYLSASLEWASSKGEKIDPFWYNPQAVHYYFMGKDNLVFHTLFWPGQLFVHDEKLHLPDIQCINQFLNLEGQKFSKSRGVQLDPLEVAARYGLDTVRFYTATISPEHADSNWDWNEFVTRTNSVLVATIGNLFNRILKLAEGVRFSENLILDQAAIKETVRIMEDGAVRLQAGSLREYVERAIALASFGNKLVTDKAPWSIKDRHSIEFASTIGSCLITVLGVGLMLSPLLPDSIERLATMLGIKLDSWDANLTTQLPQLLSKVAVTSAQPLFARIELKEKA